MIFWVGGMKYTAAVAGVLSQTATVFTLLLSWWVLKENDRQKGGGAAAAMVGAVVIGWASHSG